MRRSESLEQLRMVWSEFVGLMVFFSLEMSKITGREGHRWLQTLVDVVPLSWVTTALLFRTEAELVNWCWECWWLQVI